MKNFLPSHYLGGAQVWDIEKGLKNSLFVATNKGLSVYDGNNWFNFRQKDDITLRCLYFDKTDQKLFCASDQSFGYWVKDEFGQYRYTELYKNKDLLSTEIFWKVYKHDDKYFFQTHDKIYSYHPNNAQIDVVIEHKNITSIYTFNNELYAQIDGLLYKYDKDKFEPTNISFADKIIGIVALGEKYYLLTDKKGLVLFDGGKTIQSNIPANKQIIKAKPFSVWQLSLEKIVIGSVLDGAFVINSLGEVEKQINYQSGLKRSTVLSICSTEDDLIFGLDGGLAEVTKKPSEVKIEAQKLDIGNVYDAEILNDQLFVGTNKGLFVVTENNNFDFIDGTQGQIWDLIKISNDKLIICHDDGLLQLTTEGNEVVEISGSKLRRLVPMNSAQTKFLGLDSNQSFSIYEIKKGNLTYSHKLKDLKAANTRALIDRYGAVWVQDRENNPVRIVLDENNQTKNIKTYLINSNPALHMAMVDDDIAFYNDRKGFVYDIAIDSIVFNQHYTDLILETMFTPVGIKQVGKNDFIYSTSCDIAHIRRIENKFYNQGVVFSSFDNIETSPLAQKVIQLNDSVISTGILDGMAFLFIDRTISSKDQYPLSFSEVSVLEGDSLHLLSLNSDRVHDLPSNYTDFQIKLKNISLQGLVEYRIDNNSWIQVKPFPSLKLPKLSHGKHVVSFRNPKEFSKDEPQTITLEIYVHQPWYFSEIIIVIIILIFLSLVFLAYLIVKRRLKRQYDEITRKQYLILEKEKKDFDIEMLKIKLEEGEKSLVVLTLESMKYNNILGDVKRLAAFSGEETKPVLLSKMSKITKAIDSFLKRESPEKLFEKYFNALHKEFYDNLKTSHPDLTSNEIKLCAYIKMNMNTKDIALHSNIAAASVEVARYRLRKKLNLDNDVNLQNYIQNL